MEFHNNWQFPLKLEKCVTFPEKGDVVHFYLVDTIDNFYNKFHA